MENEVEIFQVVIKRCKNGLVHMCERLGMDELNRGRSMKYYGEVIR